MSQTVSKAYLSRYTTSWCAIVGDCWQCIGEIETLLCRIENWQLFWSVESRKDKFWMIWFSLRWLQNKRIFKTASFTLTRLCRWKQENCTLWAKAIALQPSRYNASCCHCRGLLAMYWRIWCREVSSRMMFDTRQPEGVAILSSKGDSRTGVYQPPDVFTLR